MAALVITALLAACGGGGDTVPTAAPAADVTLTQAPANLTVTPGEEVRVGLLIASCPQETKSPVCASEVRLGDLKVTSTVLQGVRMILDGNPIDGVVSKLGSSYTLAPFGYYTVYAPGMVLEVYATVVPTTPTGMTSTVAIDVATASLNKKLVISGDATKVTVAALAHYAPVVITPEVAPDGTVRGFRASCDARVAGGCTISKFSYAVNAASPNNEMHLLLSDLGWLQVFTNAQGQASSVVQTDLRIPAGSSIVVQLTATRLPSSGGESISFRDFVTKSGDKVIAPVLPEGCTAVTPQNCKGG